MPAGTDQTCDSLPADFPRGPAIILVESQLGENIGMAARAMLNCGLTEMRLVAPRDGWPSGRAIKACSGADSVLEQAALYNTTAEAVADLDFILATTARDRDMVNQVYSPQAAATEYLARNLGDTQRCGILFGPERTGLSNEDVALANGILNVPLNPGFSSLNLAQAVLLVSYAWYSQVINQPDKTLRHGHTELATKEQVAHVMRHLEDELDACDFFNSPGMKSKVMQNIISMYNRAEMTEQETRTLHGIIAALSGKKAWK